MTTTEKMEKNVNTVISEEPSQVGAPISSSDHCEEGTESIWVMYHNAGIIHHVTPIVEREASQTYVHV